MPIILDGSNFGQVGESHSVVAWSFPQSIPAAFQNMASQLVFYAINCSVIVDHVRMNCTTPHGVGGSLSWQVSIEGLISTVPESLFAPPDIFSAAIISSVSP